MLKTCSEMSSIHSLRTEGACPLKARKPHPISISLSIFLYLTHTHHTQAVPGVSGSSRRSLEAAGGELRNKKNDRHKPTHTYSSIFPVFPVSILALFFFSSQMCMALYGLIFEFSLGQYGPLQPTKSDTQELSSSYM